MSNLIKRKDGSYSQRGLWDNIRANKGSGKKPTKQMLEQERKIKKMQDGGGLLDYIKKGFSYIVDNINPFDSEETVQKTVSKPTPKPIQKSVTKPSPLFSNEIKLRQSVMESHHKPSVATGKELSPKGAKGLTQIMPAMLEDYKRHNPNEKVNLSNAKDAVKVQDWALNYIAQRPYLNKPNQNKKIYQAKVLAAYNWGPKNMKNFLQREKTAGNDIYNSLDWVKRLPAEPRKYVQGILLNQIPSFQKQLERDTVNSPYNKYYNFGRGGMLWFNQKGGKYPIMQEGDKIEKQTTEAKYNPETDTYESRYSLPEITVTGKAPRDSFGRKMTPEQLAFNQRIHNAQGQALSNLARFTVGGPQQAMMAGITGKAQYPSEVLGYQKPKGFWQNAANIGMDMALDPLAGPASVKGLYNLGKAGAKELNKAGKYFTKGYKPIQAPSVGNFDLEELRRVFHNGKRFLELKEGNFLRKHGVGKQSQYRNDNWTNNFINDQVDKWWRIRNINQKKVPPPPSEIHLMPDGTTRTIYGQNPTGWENYTNTGQNPIDWSKPKLVNRSGLTKEEALSKASSKDKDVLSKMSEEEFSNTVLKPTGEVIPYKLGPSIDKMTYDLNTRRMVLKDQVQMSPKEYADRFNEKLDLLNDIIAQRNKSGVEYRVKGIDEHGNLTFYTPLGQKDKNPLIKKGLEDVYIPAGESTWSTGINPGEWRGNVEDIANTEYFRSIPGLEMRNTSASVFSDRIPRKGTGAYESINEYLKKLDLGRVKPGFNSQTEFSRGAWENFVKSGRAVGFYNNPFTVYGTMKSILPPGIILGAGAATQQKKNGGVIADPRGQWAHPGKVTKIAGSDITMKGVPYPVFAESNKGQQVIMQPGQDYHFTGAKSVTEYPMATTHDYKISKYLLPQHKTGGTMEKFGNVPYDAADAHKTPLSNGLWALPFKNGGQLYGKSGIHIKPENKGKFTASANRAGMGVQAFASKVLANKEKYSPTLVKRANFARNAAKWKHEFGGSIDTLKMALGGQMGTPKARISSPLRTDRSSQSGMMDFTKDSSSKARMFEGGDFPNSTFGDKTVEAKSYKMGGHMLSRPDHWVQAGDAVQDLNKNPQQSWYGESNRAKATAPVFQGGIKNPLMKMGGKTKFSKMC